MQFVYTGTYTVAHARTIYFANPKDEYVACYNEHLGMENFEKLLHCRAYDIATTFGWIKARQSALRHLKASWKHPFVSDGFADVIHAAYRLNGTAIHTAVRKAALDNFHALLDCPDFQARMIAGSVNGKFLLDLAQAPA